MTAFRTPRDTVDVAASTPEREQPYAALGLKTDEYERIRAILDRRPTSAELAMYSVMWSEHCSYKSSRRSVGAAARRSAGVTACDQSNHSVGGPAFSSTTNTIATSTSTRIAMSSAWLIPQR